MIRVVRLLVYEAEREEDIQDQLNRSIPEGRTKHTPSRFGAVAITAMTLPAAFVEKLLGLDLGDRMQSARVASRLAEAEFFGHDQGYNANPNVRYGLKRKVP